MTSPVKYTLITKEDMHTCHKITLWRQVSCPFCKMCCSSSSTLLCYLVGAIGTLRCDLWPTRPCTSTELERYKHYEITYRQNNSFYPWPCNLPQNLPQRNSVVSDSQHPKSIVKIKEAKLYSMKVLPFLDNDLIRRATFTADWYMNIFHLESNPEKVSFTLVFNLKFSPPAATLMWKLSCRQSPERKPADAIH